MKIPTPLRNCCNHGNHSHSCSVKGKKICVPKSGLIASLIARHKMRCVTLHPWGGLWSVVGPTFNGMLRSQNKSSLGLPISQSNS